MATADDYAAWIVKNADKKGTPEFNIVASAYQEARNSTALQKPEPSGLTTANIIGGLVRGAGSIGATLRASPEDLGVALGVRSREGAAPTRYEKNRADMDAALQSMGADTNSWWFKGPKIVAEVAGTMGVGGGLARGAAMLPGAAKALPAIDAIRTAGFSAGGATGLGGVGARAAGGGITGAASAGLVNPDDAGLGAVIGAGLPGALQLLGAGGRAAGAVYQSAKGSPEKMLAESLGITNAEAAAIIRRAQQAPQSLVPGSKLTFAQALQQQGVDLPGVKLLERTVSGGPGGDVLLKRYADQGEARLAALQAQGAQTYQGAAADTANRMGDKLAAVLRTQAGDDKAAARAAWESVYQRGADEGVKLYLPLDELGQAMKPLGRGTVGAGKDASALVNEARNIGTFQADAIKATTDAASARPLTLAQAVRRAGGLSLSRAEGLAGELRALKGDAKNLVFNNGGRPPDRMAQMMHEAGYIESADAKTLLAALKDDARMTPQFSNFDLPERQWAAARDAAMGEAPAAEAIPIPVPFDEFQRLRRSAGSLGAKVGERAGGETEAGVLSNIQRIISDKADAAAAGTLRADEFMSPGFAAQYNAARDMTRLNAEKYKGGNNIAAILRRPSGQDYTLTGNEVFNKLWHGGAGLAGDVSNLKGVLSANNFDPSMNALREAIMTDAASKTTASGQLGAALPKYVESRLPGLQEAMTPEQLKALTSVAADIRNAEAAGSVAGLRGSDTQAKISRALDAGLLDGPMLKTLARLLTVKGVGLDWLRGKVAERVAANKGAQMAGLLADPQSAQSFSALSQPSGLLGSGRLGQLSRLGLLSAPVLAAD